MKFFTELIFNFFYNYGYRKNQNKNIYVNFSKKKIEDYYNLELKKKKIILATQVGRGGGKWLIDMINQCKNVKAFGERNRTREAQFRQSCSYSDKKNLDYMLHLIRTEALSDWKYCKSSYISSPYFSHGINELAKNLKPNKIVIIVRDFNGLLYSLLNKGWYKEKINFNLNKIPKKIPRIFKNNPNHFYGRYINLDKDNKRFNKSSRAIKVSIFIQHTLKKIYEGLLTLNKKNIEVFNLDMADQNYGYCKNFLKKININLKIEKKKFIALKKRTAMSFDNDKVLFNKKELIEIKKIKKRYDYYLTKIKLLT